MAAAQAERLRGDALDEAGGAAIRIVQHARAHYAEDIFSPEGTSSECCLARWARDLLDGIADDIATAILDLQRASSEPRAAPSPALPVDLAADERIEQLRASQPPERTREAPEPGGALADPWALLREARANLNRDKTGLAAGLNAVQSIVKGYRWIPAGEWGNYSWDEQTETAFRAEVGSAFDAISVEATRVLSASGRLANEACRRIDDALRRASDPPRAAPSDSAPATPGLGTQEGLEASAAPPRSPDWPTLCDRLLKAMLRWASEEDGIPEWAWSDYWKAFHAVEAAQGNATPKEAPSASPDSPSQGPGKQQRIKDLEGALRAFIEWDDADKTDPDAETWPLLHKALAAARTLVGTSDKPAAGPSSPSSASLESGGGTMDTTK